VPLLVAARYWPDDQRAKPWRIVTIGDPLMLVPPKQVVAPPRVKQPAPPEYGDNLLERSKILMKAAAETNDAAQFAEAIRTLELIDRDRIALQMWSLAQQQNLASGRAASAALSALFRARDAAAFVTAWNAGGPHSPLHYDMLWHLLGAKLNGGAGTISRDELLTLEAAIRPDLPSADVERLAPHVQRVFGTPHLQEFLRRQIDAATDPEQKRVLREIAGRY
jgi:hypothetical protein